MTAQFRKQHAAVNPLPDTAWPGGRGGRRHIFPNHQDFLYPAELESSDIRSCSSVTSFRVHPLPYSTQQPMEDEYESSARLLPPADRKPAESKTTQASRPKERFA